MTSAKQLAANRANSRRSTGPKSVEGKARSSLNSLKHGLTAERVVIAGEDPCEFSAFETEIIEEWQPIGRTEETLVRRLAFLLWRLNRAPLLEAAVMAARHVPINEPRARREDHLADLAEQYKFLGPESIKSNQKAQHGIRHDAVESKELAAATAPPECNRAAIGRALILDSEKGDALGKVLRYETATNNELARTMSMLISLQTARVVREQATREIPVSERK